MLNFRKQSLRCQEQQTLLLGEKQFLEETLPNISKDCLGMVHGRISKVAMDMDAEGELEEELKVRPLSALSRERERERDDLLLRNH